MFVHDRFGWIHGRSVLVGESSKSIWKAIYPTGVSYKSSTVPSLLLLEPQPCYGVIGRGYQENYGGSGPSISGNFAPTALFPMENCHHAIARAGRILAGAGEPALFSGGDEELG